MMNKIQTLVLIGLYTLITSNVFASDGVIEINLTCATQLGCFSGDTMGFPVTIDGTAGSSYILTSNLTILSTTINVIDIISDDITLDLNGFRISCVAANCNSLGTNYGIKGSFLNNIHIKNGTIESMGLGGVELSEYARLDGLVVNRNGSSGIRVGFNSIIKNCIIKDNGGDGILGSSLFGTTSGIIVSGNMVYGNGASGIKVGSASSISSNIVRNNGTNGIQTGAGSNVKGNTVQNNTGFGLSLNASAIYLENVMTGNTGGSVTSGVNMGHNFCNIQVCP